MPKLLAEHAVPKHEVHSDYLKQAFADLPGLIRKVREELEPHQDAFDGIVFRGLSGSLVAPMVAAQMGKPFAVVRKEGEACHSKYEVEGWHGFKRYIIIDDLIASGGTVKTIQTEMLKLEGSPVCVGFLLWFQVITLVWRDSDSLTFSHYESKFLYPQQDV